MKKTFKYILSTVLIMTFLFVGNVFAQDSNTLTLLFTHDIHDNLEPYTTELDGNVVTRGGYARLYSAILNEKKIDNDPLLIDGGDFAMGTLFQSVFTTQSPSLKLLGMMEYDATTFGNHEFDFRPLGLAESLNSVVASGEKSPDILSSNYSFDVENKSDGLKELEAAFENYGVKDYKIVEKNGIKIGLFGLMGYEADSNAPMAELKFTDMIEQSQRVVKLLQAEDVDMIVALSHSGTSNDKKKSEDENLAKAVPEIDVILSAHSHTTLETPIVINDTIIVSSGRYAMNLGKVVLEPNGDRWTAKEYKLIPIDDTLELNKDITDKIEEFKVDVNDKYLTQYGFKFNDIIARSPFNFTPSTSLNDEHMEEPLAHLIGDGYKYSVKEAEKDNYVPIDVAVVPSGVLRESIVEGDITVSDAFNILPLGVGKDGISGYPLISVYLSGKELETAAEVDASISPILSFAQLYMSGLKYTFNPNRIILNKVTDISLTDSENTALESDKLYRVVTDLYTAQMLGVVNDQSYGLLSIVPKDKDGLEVTNFEDHIIYDENNNEIKAWVALSDYLKSFDEKDGVPTIDMKYSDKQGFKVIENDKGIIARIKNPNIFSVAILAIVFLIIALVLLLVRFIVRRVKRKKLQTNH